MSRAVYVFYNDLRLLDNKSLAHALSHETAIDFIFCFNPAWFKPTLFNQKPLGSWRYRFLLEALLDLNEQLKPFEQRVQCFFSSLATTVEWLYQAHGVRRIYTSVHAGFNEQQTLHRLEDSLADLIIVSQHSHTLFEPKTLPFAVSQLPQSFTQFRKQVEHLRSTLQTTPTRISSFGTPCLPELDTTTRLPAVPIPCANTEHCASTEAPLFKGGETQALKHLEQYFNSSAPSTYKHTRNALDDFSSSTKFSPWLAQGCLSASQILFRLNDYESEHGANDSTYWIFFELLWREYFQWYAHKYQAKLFAFSGIHSVAPLESFYPERFQKWCKGITPYPIVNACMKQLNSTGYLSNRGRQLAASCYVNELELDWRYGAAYFQEKLIDYDVASNWGNWQYLAGVGADPRGKRRFNLDKQTERYDPHAQFIKKWQGSNTAPLDTIDAVAWPITHPSESNSAAESAHHSFKPMPAG